MENLNHPTDQPIAKSTSAKKKYKAPILSKYGEIRSLVHANPGMGPDGGFIDCSHS